MDPEDNNDGAAVHPDYRTSDDPDNWENQSDDNEAYADTLGVDPGIMSDPTE